jgi:signal transduction histidine kinase
VQELAFIRSHTRSVADDATTSPDVAEHIAAAAERALVECRHAIEILTSSDDEHQPVADLLRRAADDVARRGGTRVEVRGSPVAAVPDHVRAALQRVVREATTNAVAHGHAGSVTIDITAEERHLRLTIADDGAGFDVTQPRTGFGLRSMRERVEEVSGTFAIRSAPGEGTVVVATVPLSRSAR